MDFKNRIALVTGAAGGIGLATARRFGQAGAMVVMNDVRSDRLQESAEELRRMGVAVHAVRADVSKTVEADSMVQETIERFGGLHVLVNNAAVFSSQASILDLQEEEWERVLAVNLKGVLNCSRAAARHMVDKRRGRIVNLASLVGKRGRVILSEPGGPTQAAYAVSKAGIIALTKSMAYEWAPYNVGVNAVAPGPIDTGQYDPAAKRRVSTRVPLGRLGSTDEVAWAVLFLASEESSFITGEILDVNGGVDMD